MATTYEICNSDDVAAELGADILRSVHTPLDKAEVTITYVFVYGPKDKEGETTGPAMKVRGHRALGKVKINSLKDRVEGKADATVWLDGDEWPLMDEAGRRALIDHELTHLELAVDNDGAVQRDDIGRPKLKLRHHDWEIGGFTDIVERHGETAIEAQALQGAVAAVRKMVQRSFWDHAPERELAEAVA